MSPRNWLAFDAKRYRAARGPHPLMTALAIAAVLFIACIDFAVPR
jgi:hypothetical protein